jgi:hypothetical protein
VVAEDRWTFATQELVASRGAGHSAAADILEALFEVGLLLTPGFERTEEWAIRVDKVHPFRSERIGHVMTHLGTEKSQRCREIWDGWTPVSRGVTTWPDGTVMTGPWIEVPQ